MSAPAGRTAEPAGIVVQRGDSLWGIVARHLGPQASAAEVAAQWPRWYAANRRVIGPEPDRVLPGQIVRAPAATADGEQ
ncbi:LysM peptidoglycan-binding domain-containing protein [Pedococcus sp. 5OH_020]|uniref:LysM peptidoglycan-binding domain-containing protein n=1 Tax=Pedococcus sp. 5OH_020 TaxID=2989814 RepID=UPI0022E9A5E6|nr:LysM domain-containing protein [Pedococcus sp. 5OH_020]